MIHIRKIKLLAIACVVVMALAGLAACGGGSKAAQSGSGGAPSSSSQSSVKTGPLEFKDLLSLSNDEVQSRLEANGNSKGSNGAYTKDKYEVALGDGYRTIIYNGPDLAYTMLKESGQGFSKLGEYFNKYDNVEFAVGVCQVGDGTGVVAGSGGTKNVVFLVCEPGHMGALSKINTHGSYSDSMSADEAARAFVKGLESNYFSQMEGDKI